MTMTDDSNQNVVSTAKQGTRRTKTSTTTSTTTRLLRSLTAAAMLFAMGGAGLSTASATPIEPRDHFVFIQSDGTSLAGITLYDYTSSNLGYSLAGGNTQDVGGTDVSSVEQIIHFANLTTGEVKALAYSEFTSITGPAVSEGDYTLQTTAGGIIADTFSIVASNPADLLPGSMATITFTVNGVFNLPAGLDIDSGGFFNPLNGASAYASLSLFEPGAIELSAQLAELNPADFPNNAAFVAAQNAIIAEYNTKPISFQDETLFTHQATVDALGLPNYNLATNGPGQMILTAQVALDDLETTFEWLAQLSTQTTLDASAGETFIQADFASTGVLTIAVPKGFSVTSASGVFPQSNVTIFGAADTNPVPEPMTAALGVLSIASLMFATRRRCVA